MKKSLFALLITTTYAMGAANASASNDAKVQCKDGTIFTLNDAITAEVACEYHGGISKSKLISANEFQTNHAVSLEPTGSRVFRKFSASK